MSVGPGPQERVCPHCGERIKPRPILYGYPTDEAWELEARGEVRLGGCVIEPESPDYVCPECDAFLPWVSPARLGGR